MRECYADLASAFEICITDSKNKNCIYRGDTKLVDCFVFNYGLMRSKTISGFDIECLKNDFNFYQILQDTAIQNSYSKLSVIRANCRNFVVNLSDVVCTKHIALEFEAFFNKDQLILSNTLHKNYATVSNEYYLTLSKELRLFLLNQLDNHTTKNLTLSDLRKYLDFKIVQEYKSDEDY